MYAMTLQIFKFRSLDLNLNPIHYKISADSEPLLTTHTTATS